MLEVFNGNNISDYAWDLDPLDLPNGKEITGRFLIGDNTDRQDTIGRANGSGIKQFEQTYDAFIQFLSQDNNGFTDRMDVIKEDVIAKFRGKRVGPCNITSVTSGLSIRTSIKDMADNTPNVFRGTRTDGAIYEFTMGIAYNFRDER